MEMEQKLKFDRDGLIPVIIQDRDSQVLMLAYMNQEALDRTLATGYTWFYSRSRQRLWQKGETSGHRQRVAAITADCDHDTLLVTVEQIGPGACHE
ncbi:MAG TPA: phosphoribosyl-AMP cyclohydrolase, partial [Limnochordia bacterium]|nr:phosphoribosyl-AMP cyclohydrolase [Limnochordia bacterium]